MEELFLNNVIREIVSLDVGGIILSRRNMSDVTIHTELDGDMSLMGDTERLLTMKWITVSKTNTFSSPDMQGLLGTSKIFRSDRSLHSGSQTVGLGFHGRHASVPSSPTQHIPSRHRRLSEPFNVLTADYFSSKLSVPGSPISAASDDHGSVKFGDNSKPILFKTELCRSWAEKGSCRYGYVP